MEKSADYFYRAATTSKMRGIHFLLVFNWFHTGDIYMKKDIHPMRVFVYLSDYIEKEKNSWPSSARQTFLFK